MIGFIGQTNSLPKNEKIEDLLWAYAAAGTSQPDAAEKVKQAIVFYMTNTKLSKAEKRYANKIIKSYTGRCNTGAINAGINSEPS